MRFEEVSHTLESRILQTATASVARISEDVHILLGTLTAAGHEVNGTIRTLDMESVTSAATRALAPGGLASVLLVISLLLRLLQYVLVKARSERLLNAVSALAKEENHSKDD